MIKIEKREFEVCDLCQNTRLTIERNQYYDPEINKREDRYTKNYVEIKGKKICNNCEHVVNYWDGIQHDYRERVRLHNKAIKIGLIKK